MRLSQLRRMLLVQCELSKLAAAASASVGVPLDIRCCLRCHRWSLSVLAVGGWLLRLVS